MQVEHLWLTDYRSYGALDLELPSGLTAVLGPNGQGKTNLLEAVGWLATMSSFRGAPTEALVRAMETACASMSLASTLRRSAFAAAMASTPVPVPISNILFTLP